MKSRHNQTAAERASKQAYRQSGSKGAALVITLILLLLLSAGAVAIVLLVSSDSMINGYYRNYRGSFYAADSGINVAVESIKNSVLTTATPNGTNGAPPLSAGGAAMPATTNTFTNAGVSASSFLSAAYAKYQDNYYSVGDTGSWNGQFEIIPNPDGNPLIGQVQFAVTNAAGDADSCWPPSQATCFNGKSTVTNDHDYTWTYEYPYEITVKGQSSGTEAEEITERGMITYTNTSGTIGAATPPNFAQWAAFITNYAPCLGALVPGYMTGPFFTNGQWGFGNFSNPGYTFTGSVGQAGGNASWFPSGGGCVNSPTAPAGMKAPNFQAGFQTGQAAISAPVNSYSQEQAVLDAKGAPPCAAAPCAADPAPTNAQMNQVLKTVSGTPYPSSGSPSSGVYVPWYSNNGVATFGSSGGATGGTNPAGGFYVAGNAAVTLSATTGGDGTSNPTQTYKITQGSTTTTIVVDTTANTTSVTSGSSKLTLQGVPEQLDPTTGQQITQNDPSGNAVNPTLVYVSGTITGLQGTVQNNTGLTIAAGGNVDITGNVTYAQEPVSVPADTLNTSTNAGVLGVYTATGNIVLSSPYSNKNLEVDGSLAAIGGSCANNSCGFTVSGSINTFNNVGGQIQTNIFAANMSAENTYYDQRFGSMAPPWFPTAVPQAGAPALPSFEGASVSRSSWDEIRP